MTSNNPFGLDGKNVLITGASSGIGEATALSVAGAGAVVIATARNKERLSGTLSRLQGNNHRQIVADLNETCDLEQLADAIETLDGVVLCAGINEAAPLKFATRKKISSIFETNFFAQIELLRLLVKKKKLNQNASVVAISSIGGIESFSIGQAAYGASKAALLSWMKFAAKELSGNKIRVNCILPGHINTPMNDRIAFTEEQLDAYRDTIPLKRFGEPDDVANGIVYLLSDAASWVTGTALKIDGGSTL